MPRTFIVNGMAARGVPADWTFDHRVLTYRAKKWLRWSACIAIMVSDRKYLKLILQTHLIHKNGLGLFALKTDASTKIEV